MGEIWLAAKLLGWGKTALEWLRSLPWYVFALLVCAIVIFWQGHELGARDKRLAQAAEDAKGWSAAHTADLATIGTLRAQIGAQNKAVDGFKKASDAAAQRAAEAKAQAARDAASRARAIAALRAAPAPVVDCPAPAAHNAVRGQL